MKNFMLVLVSFLFLVAMFSSCEDNPVKPDPPDPTPEAIFIKVKAVDQNIMTARLYIPALDIYHSIIPWNDTSGIIVHERVVAFSYDEFHNTTQLIKVEIIVSINGDGKAPYETTPLEQNILIDEDKTIVFAL